MEKLTLLVKIKHFPQSVNSDLTRLRLFITDYADCSSSLLEQMGYYRYRRQSSCIVGKNEPEAIINTLMNVDEQRSFFCNMRSRPIPQDERKRAVEHPEEYAIVLYDCFK